MFVGWEVGEPCHNWRTIRPHGTTSARGNVLASVQYTEVLVGNAWRYLLQSSAWQIIECRCVVRPQIVGFEGQSGNSNGESVQATKSNISHDLRENCANFPMPFM